VPTYQYACTACGERTEAVQAFTDAPLTDCPACSGRLRKVFSAVGVVFKGSGFYKTDSRRAEKSGAAAAANSGGAEAGAGSSGGTDASAGGTDAGAGSSGGADRGSKDRPGRGGEGQATPAAATAKSDRGTDRGARSGDRSNAGGSAPAGGPKTQAAHSA